jgi:hypothetical protein
MHAKDQEENTGMQMAHKEGGGGTFMEMADHEEIP